jgi:hypothetical protein
MDFKCRLLQFEALRMYDDLLLADDHVIINSEDNLQKAGYIRGNSKRR